MKHIQAILLVLIVAILFFGCSSTSEPDLASTPIYLESSIDNSSSSPPSSSSADNEVGTFISEQSLPIITDNSVTLKIWYSLTSDVLALTNNLADGTNYAWSEAMRRTGIQIEFTHPVDSNELEQYQLMIASEDYPDIYKGYTSIYAGGLDKAIADGVYLRLNELAKSFSPNYMLLVNSSETNRKNNVTDSGNMVAFCQIYDRVQPAFVGYAVRQDWLDDLGLERPETYEDWHNVLTMFKNFKTSGGAGPMELCATGIPASNAFSGGFGVNSRFFIQKEGKILFSQIEPGFREYLELMSLWYKEGLIDRDFITNGGYGFYPNNTRVANNESGAVAMMYTYAGNTLANIAAAEAGAYFTLTKWPVKEAGTSPSVAFRGEGEGELLSEFGAMIFKSCKYPEYASRFIDYFYSEEGAFVANYGIEGVTYNLIDGKPMQTELITNNPDGISNITAQSRYLVHNGFMLFMLGREEDVQSEAALEYRDLWSPAGKWNITGSLSYTVEEGIERSNLLNEIQAYVTEQTVKFIMGVNELNDNTWSDFTKQIKSMGVERVTQITQNAFDRYQARTDNQANFE